MTKMLDQPAKDPFLFRECFLMTMPIGIKVGNLRELLHVIREVKESVLYYHLFQTRLAVSPPAVEYPNDFALWAGTALQEIALAEKLSSFDPLDYTNMGQVRQAIVDIIEEYLWETPFVPWARPGFELHCCEASTVVIRSKISAHNLREFCQALQGVGVDSIYYHFFEARWRLESPIDDFSYWIETNFDLPELVTAIRGIDIYFHNLKEIRQTLINLIQRHLGKFCGEPQ
uniref:Uncharacterized protein n=1 Tax=Desulfobacca acetoxidans TaxID=60893 RepID=A0A7C3YXI1_9BACT